MLRWFACFPLLAYRYIYIYIYIYKILYGMTTCRKYIQHTMKLSKSSKAPKHLTTCRSQPIQHKPKNGIKQIQPFQSFRVFERFHFARNTRREGFSIDKMRFWNHFRRQLFASPSRKTHQAVFLVRLKHKKGRISTRMCMPRTRVSC